MTLSGNLDAQRRRDSLVALANEPGGVSIDAAATLFEVSSMTIRRDLLELETEGRVRRVRGGATAASRARPFDARRAQRARAKRIIADKALPLIPPSGTLALDASTTISTLASLIGPRNDLTVHTNAVETFQILQPLEGVTAVLSGGTAEPTTGSLTGPIAVRSLGSVYYGTFFASADALDPEDGSSEVSLEEAEVKRVLAANATTTVLCIDSSKLDRRSVARALTREDISVLITELDPADERLRPFRNEVELR